MLPPFGYICLGLLALFGLGLTVVMIRAYARFRRSALCRWRDAVFGLQTEARRRLLSAKAKLRLAGASDKSQEESLTDQAFLSFLSGLSVELLDAYPGIGPATLSKLRDAGYSNLAQMQNGSIDVAGLGEKRQNDVKHGVRDLTKQARSRFQAGACREAQDLAALIEHLRANTTEEAYRAQTRVRAIELLLEKMQPLIEMARHITLVEFLKPTNVATRLAAFQLIPLPDLDEIVQAADAEARAAFAASKPTSAPPATEAAEPVRMPGMHEHLATAVALKRAVPSSQVNDDLFVETPTSVPSHADHLTLLEIDPDTTLSADLIRRQYNLLSERYAAEKFVNAGPEFVALAQRKREAILAAATALLKEYGENVETAAPAAAAPQEIRHNPDLDAVFGG